MTQYKCDFCNKVFSTSEICLEHIESDNEENYGYIPVCPGCERVYLLGFKEQEVNKNENSF